MSSSLDTVFAIKGKEGEERETERLSPSSFICRFDSLAIAFSFLFLFSFLCRRERDSCASLLFRYIYSYQKSCSLSPSVSLEWNTRTTRWERWEEKKDQEVLGKKKRNEVSAANCTFLFLPSLSNPVSTKLEKFLYFYSLIDDESGVFRRGLLCVTVNAWFFLYFLSICWLFCCERLIAFSLTSYVNHVSLHVSLSFSLL